MKLVGSCKNREKMAIFDGLVRGYVESSGQCPISLSYRHSLLGFDGCKLPYAVTW